MMESLINHQSQLISLYGSLFRNGNIELFMKSLQKIIYDLRQVIMTTQNAHIQQAHFDILKLVYKLIPYCRDIYGGLGERQLSYAMLFVWKYLFPVPAAQCFYKMVMPMDGNPPFGSWRDVKGLCSHVRKYSELKEKDPFIETCIGFMNNQLEEDRKAWDEALDNYNRKLGTPWETKRPVISETDVSLVCRWIPRENSAHKWLFERCVIQWMRAYRPHYLKSIGTHRDRFVKCLNKGKKEYRHLFTRLSKAWDTLEIKQCGKQWSRIDPNHIPMRAMTKQQHALLNIGGTGNVRHGTMHDKDRETCAIKIQSWWKTHRSNFPVFIEMGDLIKQALRVRHVDEIQRLESLWKCVCGQIVEMPYMIPFLDLSLFRDDVESFYHALGMALAVASRSTLFGKEKRLFAFDNGCYIVPFETGGGLMSMMETIKPIYHQHHIGSNLRNACIVCASALKESGLDDGDILNLSLMVFGGSHMNLRFDLLPFKECGIETPSVLCWLSQPQIIEIELSGPTDERKYPFFVGNSNHSLSRISQLPSDTWKHISQYGFLKFLLSHERYKPFDEYFNGLRNGGTQVPP